MKEQIIITERVYKIDLNEWEAMVFIHYQAKMLHIFIHRPGCIDNVANVSVRKNGEISASSYNREPSLEGTIQKIIEMFDF